MRWGPACRICADQRTNRPGQPRWQALAGLRVNGSVAEVLDHLKAARRLRLPGAIADRELATFNREGEEELPPMLAEIERIHAVSYAEISALRRYLDVSSPFETKDGVKGAEFENVLVIVGRGRNLYNFNEMLELAEAAAIPAARQAAYERNRNLLYVACSRPKRRLALLFTQQLSPAALTTLENWFGADNIETLVLGANLSHGPSLWRCGMPLRRTPNVCSKQELTFRPMLLDGRKVPRYDVASGSSRTNARRSRVDRRRNGTSVLWQKSYWERLIL